MANAEPDGQMVNIPSLHIFSMEGRRVVVTADYWISADVSRREDRKIRLPHFSVNEQVRLECGFARAKCSEHASEKSF